MRFGEFYPKSQPRAVAGGIKARSKTGAFGTSWWAKRWTAVLEGFNIGARLGRGRSYARKGQVTAIRIGPGRVTATVQGSRPQPYAVTIEVNLLTAKDWDKLVGALNTQAAFAAKLLAGEMPQDIESAFTKAGLSLFPTALKGLKTACSCPDYSNPCKHIAAVYYLLGEEFDRDPFLLFRLRGGDRAAIVGRLSAGAAPAAPAAAPPAPPEPLPADAAAFWACGPLPAEGEVRPPPVDAAAAKRLGGFPFWRGADRFLDAVTPTYAAAARRGVAAFDGDTPPPAGPPPGRRVRTDVAVAAAPADGGGGPPRVGSPEGRRDHPRTGGTTGRSVGGGSCRTRRRAAAVPGDRAGEPARAGRPRGRRRGCPPDIPLETTRQTAEKTVEPVGAGG